MSSNYTGVADAAKDRVLTILRAHPSGLRSDQVRSRLAGAGMPLDLPAVTQILHALQRQKLLTYPNRRWTLKDPLEVRPLSSMPTSQSPSRRANPAPVTVPLPAPSTTPAQSASGLSPCLPFEVVLVDAAQTAEPPALGRSLLQGWPLLRRLLPYWREALRAEERPNTILSLERANIEFCGLTTADPWWPTEQKRAEISLRVERIPQELLANLARRGNSADVFLGYPVQVIPGTDQHGAFARPIFTFACRLFITAGALKLTVPAQAIDINAGWLEKQFRDPTERRGVLQWLGITSPAAPEDDDETEPTGEPLDLPTATVRLSAYLPTTNGHLLAPTAPLTSLPQTTPTPQVINALVLFTAPTTQYSKRTLADLHTLATWNDSQLTQTALAALLVKAAGADSAHTQAAIPAVPPLPLNEDQYAATRTALNAPLTVITGPPGTGKSQVVAAIMASAALTGRTALLASKNHKALDAVEERLADLLPDERTILARASRPYGTGKAFDLRQAANALLACGAGTGDRTQLARQVSRLVREHQRLTEIESRLQRQADLAEQIGEVEVQIEDGEGTLAAVQVEWARQRLALALPAPPPPATARPVLPVLAALSRWRHRQRARLFLRRLTPLGIPCAVDDDERRLASYRQLHRYQQALIALEAAKRQLLPVAEAAALTDNLAQGHRGLADQAAQVFQQLPQALEDLNDDARPQLAELTGAMALFAGDALGEQGNQERRRVIGCALPLLLHHMPLWAVTNLSAGRALPLVPGLFDYVIIDEASQCDIASAVPLLARAKRAVIVGDPAQLRHVTKLSQERELHLLESNGLLAAGIGRWSYRSQSLFSLAAGVPGVATHLLRDHYRSAGAIVDYYNEAFYGGRLRVLTDQTQLHPPPGQKPGIHWTDVRGTILGAASGCHAPDEVNAIIEHLRHLLQVQGYTGRIGIVTAFREQAKRLTDRLTEALPPELIARGQLGAFTAHQFQGDARDLILLSLCLGPDMPPGSRAFLTESGNLINVAVSRARAVCHVFGNREASLQSEIPHIVKLAQTPERTKTNPPGTSAFESPWERTLHDALRARGVEPIPQFPLAGRRLDLAVIRGARKIDVEVDGDRYHRDPSGRRQSSDLWRDHQIRSLGWQVKRFWVYQLREDLDGCVDDVIATADQ